MGTVPQHHSSQGKLLPMLNVACKFPSYILFLPQASDASSSQPLQPAAVLKTLALVPVVWNSIKNNTPIRQLVKRLKCHSFIAESIYIGQNIVPYINSSRNTNTTICRKLCIYAHFQNLISHNNLSL